MKSIPHGLKPDAEFKLPDGSAIGLYERPLHPEFIRPCSIADVIEMLNKIPHEFLIGLRGIYLLGGTAKQKRGGDPIDGVYDYIDFKIYLAAWLKRDFVLSGPQLPPPHAMSEYKRAGVKIERVKGGWECHFDEQSLRRYYLESVLLHEIGHHVARNENKSYRKNENFADWMAIELNRKTQ